MRMQTRTPPVCEHALREAVALVAAIYARSGGLALRDDLAELEAIGQAMKARDNYKAGQLIEEWKREWVRYLYDARKEA